MSTPHKHAELIIAWANGAEIQVWVSEQWIDIGKYAPTWSDNTKYRIKPEKKWVRVALLTNNATVNCTFEDKEKITEANPFFKRWITDRIYYE